MPALRMPSGPEADLYLEGHDQHRGWFHSARCLIACALYGRAPYKGLLTHGFVVDGAGPQDEQVGRQRGGAAGGERQDGRRDPAPVVRQLDRLLGRPRHRRQDPGPRRGRLPPHPQHLALPSWPMSADFDAKATDAVPLEQMLEVDRYALARAARVPGRGPLALPALRVPPGGGQAAGLLLGRPGRLLPGRPEGPPLHDGARRAWHAARPRPRCGT